MRGTCQSKMETKITSVLYAKIKFGDNKNNHLVIKIITWIKLQVTKLQVKVTKRISPVNLWHERLPKPFAKRSIVAKNVLQQRINSKLKLTLKLVILMIFH